jgi:hypothetical protein
MEKFSKFTDASIGINPFSQQLFRPTLIEKINGYFLIIFRLPLLILFFTLLISVDYFISILPILLALPLRHILLRPIARLILVILGFYSLDESHLSRLVGTSSSVSQASRNGGKRVLILTNMCGFIDVLVWLALVAPQLTFCNEKGVIEGTTLLQQFFKIAMLGNNSSIVSKNNSNESWFQKESKKSSFASPLLIQPECAMSNNKSILEFYTPALLSLSSIYEFVQIECAVLKYSSANTSVSPCYVAGSIFSNFLVIASQFQNSVTILWVNHDDIPVLKDKGGAGLADVSAWGTSLREILCKALKVKGVKGIGKQAHDEFVAMMS